MLSSEPAVRHKRGDTREDGMRFWAYVKACKDGEWWMPPDKFEARLEKQRLSDKKRQNSPTRVAYRKSDARLAYQRGLKRTPKYREVRNAARRERLQNDPVYRLVNCLRSSTARARVLAGQDKPSSTFDILGADLETFKVHIESQFTDGMSWENQGVWHIDHIVPLASGKTPEEIYSLCHYTNLQPLWAGDNFRKGAKIPEQLFN